MPLSIRAVRAPLACVAMLLGCWTLTAAADAPAIAESDYTKLIEADLKLVDAAAAAPTDKKAVNRGKMAAMMVALYAQNQAAKNPKMAGVRDAALKAFEAIKDDKAANAKGLIAAALKDDAKGNAKAVDLHKNFDISDLMNQFGSEKGSGVGLEKKIKDHVKKGMTSPELVDVLHKVAIIGQYSEHFAPAKDEGKKKKADWIKWSQDMTKAAVEAAAVAKGKPSPTDLKKALAKLDVSCTECHGVFRD
jgi:hypothetical protein